MKKNDELGVSTKCVHIWGRVDKAYGSLVTPIYQTTTYEIQSMTDLIDINVTRARIICQHQKASGKP